LSASSGCWKATGLCTRDLALYLQVLQAERLPMAVQQATFHVATQLVPEALWCLAERPGVGAASSAWLSW